MERNRIYSILLSVCFLFPVILYAGSQERTFIPPTGLSGKQELAGVRERLRSVERLVADSLSNADSVTSGHIINELVLSAGFYYYMCDYRSAFDMLVNALSLAEKFGYSEQQALIYANMGNIYGRFNKTDIAREHYRKALALYRDSIAVMITLNNLGALELEDGHADSSYVCLDRSLDISRRLDPDYSYSIYNSLALYYMRKGDYAEAYGCFTRSLAEVRRLGRVEKEAEILSHLGEFFLEVGQIDSASMYIGLSDSIAAEYDFFSVQMQNLFMSSRIAEMRGLTEDALLKYKQYTHLKDSLYSNDRLGEIYQLQRLYEVSKSDRRINALEDENEGRGRTIIYQKYVLTISSVIFTVICVISVSLFIQKRKLNLAYRRLVEKNRQIVDMQKMEVAVDAAQHNPVRRQNKERRHAEDSAACDGLILRIRIVMENTDIICNPEFNIDELAELVQSNRTYVSQAVNEYFGKNFRSLLNGYRVQEALRLFSGPDASHFTIEAIAQKVGFLSRSTFRNAFSEVTGVNPSFYLKSIQKQHKS